MTGTREAFLETMARLIETQGYYATGLNQIVAESGAPKGSLYYYFPDGKEGLSVEVVERTHRAIEARIREQLALEAGAPEAVRRFLQGITHAITVTDCRGGGPIATIALETAGASERLRAACDAAYRAWQAAFADKLSADAYDPARVPRLAALIIAAIEGAVILCRTGRSAAPMQHVAEEIYELLRAARTAPAEATAGEPGASGVPPASGRGDQG